MNRKDITGERFNHLTVLRAVGRSEDHHVLWECQCDCGGITTVQSNNLRSGTTKACGCLHYGKGENSHNWKGGRRADDNGYIMIRKPEHPYAEKRGYVREHRLVMEKHFSRYLTKDEVVHHRKGKDNNKLKNLFCFENRGQHMIFHHEKRRLKNAMAG